MKLSKILRTAIPLLFLALLSAPAHAAQRPTAVEASTQSVPAQSKLYLPIMLKPNPDPCAGDPVDVMLVIDRSGSMYGQPLIDEKIAAKGFVDRMNMAADLVGLVSFESAATLDQPLTHDSNSVKLAIDALDIGGGTNAADGINFAQAELALDDKGTTYRGLILQHAGRLARTDSALGEVRDVIGDEGEAGSPAGRIALHLVCYCKDHRFLWHWVGIRREFGTIRPHRANHSQAGRRPAFRLGAGELICSFYNKYFHMDPGAPPPSIAAESRYSRIFANRLSILFSEKPLKISRFTPSSNLGTT